MWLRLRQIALVAAELAPLERAIGDVFGLAPCYRDPAVAEFGLENVLFPIGKQFLEIVAPTRPGTAAGRFLERRGGDGGYMVITQCDDHAPRRARVEALGVRIAHAFEMENFRNMQLHPGDTGGSFFEIDQQLGADAECPDGPWAPAGAGWRDYVRTDRVQAIAAAEIQAADPARVAQRWSEIAEIAADDDAGVRRLRLDNAALYFVPRRDGRPDGLAGLTLASADPDAVLAAARARGLNPNARGFTLGGIRWSLQPA